MVSNLRACLVQRRSGIAAVLAIAAGYAGMQWAGIPCPIQFLTGVSCAGCGMTRAWLALLRLDLASAFAWHPLFWLPPVVLAAYLLRRHIPKRVLRIGGWTAVGLFLLVYILRMADPENTVVVFRPRLGLVYQGAAQVRALFLRLFP